MEEKKISNKKVIVRGIVEVIISMRVMKKDCIAENVSAQEET